VKTAREAICRRDACATRLVLACVCAAALPRALAGEPSVQAELAAKQVFEGESVGYEVRVSDMKEAAVPDLTDIKKDFEVATAGRYESSQNFFDGRKWTSSVSTSFRYQLTPKHSGSVTVPAPFIMLDGKKISGQPLPLRVIADEQQDIVLVKIETSRQRVAPYQPFDVILKILVKPLQLDDRDPVQFQPRLQFNWINPPAGVNAKTTFVEWLDPLLSRNNTGFVFEVNNQSFAFNLYKGREQRKGLDGKNYNYFVYELKRTFFATRAGKFEFGPATIKGQFVDGVDMAKRQYSNRALVAVASAVSVEAVLPEPRPADFNGCYGRYHLRASANATDLRVGDPLTLKLDFERTANAGLLEEVTAPDLSANKELAADFTIVDKAPPGQAKGDVKTFAYVLRPKKAGVSIPPITVSAYNTDSEKFEPLVSNAVALNVTDAPQLRPDELISGAPINSGHRITGREKGVFQNIAEPSEISVSALHPNEYWLAIAGMWIAYAAGALAITLHRRRAGDAVLQNRLRARAEAAAQLSAARAAMARGDHNGAAEAVAHALTALIGNWRGISPAGMTAQDAAKVLEKSGASNDTRNETVRVLEAIEASKYGSVEGMQAAAMVESAEKLVARLQREMGGKC